MNADEAPEGALARHAEVLAAGIDAALVGWVVRCVEDRMVAWSGTVPDAVRAAATEAGHAARRDVGPRVAAALAQDPDDQPASPLSVLRDAVRYPTRVLVDAGVPPIVRDEVDERLFPEDRYGLAPASFADIDPALHDAGIAWGAAKAYVHLSRRRAEGRG